MYCYCISLNNYNESYDFFHFFLSQFDRYDPLYEEKGKISEKDFGQILLTYAGYPDQKKSRMLKRVKKKYKEDPKVWS